MVKLYYLIIGCLLCLLLGGVLGYTLSSRGASADTERARAAIAELREYQSAEAERIERERRSVEETDRALRELEQLDRRSSDLYTYIGKKLDILEGYWNSRDQLYSSTGDSANSEVK